MKKSKFKISREFCPAIKGVFKGSPGNVWTVAILAFIQGEVTHSMRNFDDKNVGKNRGSFVIQNLSNTAPKKIRDSPVLQKTAIFVTNDTKTQKRDSPVLQKQWFL